MTQKEQYSGVTCKRCRDAPSVLQRAAHTKMRLKGSIAMARYCMRLVSIYAKVPVDEKNIAALDRGIDRWYEEQKRIAGK